MKRIKIIASCCILFTLFSNRLYGYEIPYILKNVKGNSCTYTLVTDTGTSETNSSYWPGGSSHTQLQYNDILIVIENCVITRNDKNVPVYDEDGSDEDVQDTLTTGNIIFSPRRIFQYQPIDVQFEILNVGNPDTSGQFAAAIYDSDNQFAGYVETKTVASVLPGLTSGQNLTFHSDAITLSPGNYSVCIYYKPANGDWILLEDGNGTPACTQLTVIAPSEGDDDEYSNDDSDNTGIFDVIVSLDNDPRGAERYPYEETIRYWADGIYEQSNGAHKLGKVKVFPNGQSDKIADVKWIEEKGRSHGYPSGFGNEEGSIIFLGEQYISSPDMGGYALAHEWGHYAYMIFDEYQEKEKEYRDWNYMPRFDDIPVSPSIMHYQGYAKNGRYEWLNHSTSNNYKENNIRKTGQGRFYGKSGWEVLIQKSHLDPRHGYKYASLKRKHYSDLVGREPTEADGWMKLEIPTQQAEARDRLEIIWMDRDVQNQIQVVIDCSGSMKGEPLENAKAAAKMLLDIVLTDKTAVGIISFSSRATQIYPITTISAQDVNVKADIKNAIDGISATYQTAIYDAADLALSNLLTHKDEANASQVVFLLTDGTDNKSSETESSVIRKYRQHDVSMITFGYGSASPTGTLRSMADSTGGSFYFSPTTLAEIQQAFLAATAHSSESVSLANLIFSALPGSPVSQNFGVDSTLDSLNVIVSYTGTASDMVFSLKNSAGADTGVAFSYSEVTGSTTAIANVSPDMLVANGTGSWSLSAVNNTGSNIDVNMNVIANPSAGRTYNIVTTSFGGNTITYPSPIVIGTTVMKGMPITGVNLTGTIETPDGTRRSISMNDNGTDGDAIAEDGLYSAILGYSGDGTYTIKVQVDNEAGNARHTLNGLLPAPDEDGNLAMPDLSPITENFTRTTMVQVTVQEYQADDHSDTSPTDIPAEDIDFPGSVDFVGDVDVFQVSGIDPSKNLVIRVTDLALGMEPVLTIYKSDRQTVLASRTLSDALSKNGYVYFDISPHSLDSSGVLFAEVRHANPSAAQGTYNISAGAFLTSDMSNNTTVTTSTTSTSTTISTTSTTIPSTITTTTLYPTTTTTIVSAKTDENSDQSGAGDTNCFIQTLSDGDMGADKGTLLDILIEFLLSQE